MENNLSAIGIIVLAILTIIITLPPGLIVFNLLSRNPLPEKFQNERETILASQQGEYTKWKRRQIIKNIGGYVLGISLILIFTIHILVMSIIMGEKMTHAWMRAFLAAAIIDYLFLQTSKGAILICCLSEGFVDFILTFFSGSLF